MHNKLLAISLCFLVVLFLFSFTVHAAGPTPDCVNNFDPNNCAAGSKQLEDIFTNVISVVVGLGFIGLLVMLITAGFQYLTSGGEPKAVAMAHQTVTWALLGVIFMAIAWIVLQLIRAFTGIDVTIFKFSLP